MKTMCPTLFSWLYLYITIILFLWDLNIVLWITYYHLYYAPCLACWALFGSPAMCSHTSCTQVYDLPQSHCDDNLKGTSLSWLHIHTYIYISKSAQWIGSNIIPDIEKNKFFTTLSFMCYNREVNNWSPHLMFAAHKT